MRRFNVHHRRRNRFKPVTLTGTEPKNRRLQIQRRPLTFRQLNLHELWMDGTEGTGRTGGTEGGTERRGGTCSTSSDHHHCSRLKNGTLMLSEQIGGFMKVVPVESERWITNPFLLVFLSYSQIILSGWSN